MNSYLTVIATYLVLKMKELGSVESLDLKRSSFLIDIKVDECNFVFSCSLHHLDIPWQIKCEVLKNKKNRGSLEKLVNPSYTYDKPTYEITPVFLKDVEFNMLLLGEKIKKDVENILLDWKS